MAIYTCFFLCEPDALLAGFPGWKRPLARPVRRRKRNPLTGVEYVVESREPKWPKGAEADLRYQVVELTGEYEAYLEECLPPFVRSCPHWPSNGLTDEELNPLFEVLGVTGSLENAIHGPPGSPTVEQLPPMFLAALAAAEHNTVARHWARVMSASEHTLKEDGERVTNGWKTRETTSVLKSVVGLVCQAAPGQQMYLLTAL